MIGKRVRIVAGEYAGREGVVSAVRDGRSIVVRVPSQLTKNPWPFLVNAVVSKRSVVVLPDAPARQPIEFVGEALL